MAKRWRWYTGTKGIGAVEKEAVVAEEEVVVAEEEAVVSV